MSFLNVYNALYDQLSNSSFLDYVHSTQFYKGFRDNFPQQNYIVIIEPGNENEESGTRGTSQIKHFAYSIDIYARLMRMTGIEYSITGYQTEKGVLEFIDDIREALREDKTLGYSRPGNSVSAVNVGTSFDLTSSLKYISVSINGREPSGFDSIECGELTLSGTAVAANIQTSLRALGNHADDGYYNAICTFDDTDKQFTITSHNIGPKSSVIVTSGASDDCSALLGFDDPIELVGRNIVKLELGNVVTDNSVFPVRYRVLPVTVTEEILV